jgi:hypothetical protein
MIHRLMLLLALAASSIPAGAALAQGSPAEQAACKQGFAPLREDAEEKGRMIKAASARHAPAEEACKLIHSYSVAQAKMIKYVEANAAQCGIEGALMEQLKAGRRTTEGLEKKVCTTAEQARGQPRGPVGDFPDPVKGRF